MRVYVIGTADTKGAELAYAKARVIAAGAEAVLVDVGTRPGKTVADVSAEEVAGHHPQAARRRSLARATAGARSPRWRRR